MNRKHLVCSLAFALCLLLLSGCSPSPTAVTVGGRKVDASEYAFYLSYNRISTGEASGTILYDEEDTAAAKTAATAPDENSEYHKKFKDFIKNLSELTTHNQQFQKADIVNTYKDHVNKIHIHHLKNKDNEYLVIKNFGSSFFEGYGYPAFPQGNWEEIFNSDDANFGGSGYENANAVKNQNNQGLKLAANSAIILKKV